MEGSKLRAIKSWRVKLRVFEVWRDISKWVKVHEGFVKVFGK
jgi:hypothetical protein